MNRPLHIAQFDRRSAMPLRRGVIAALDVGTSKVACLIGEHSVDGSGQNGLLRISGLGHHVSEGVVAGQVVDMRLAEDSIRAAVDAAERMAGMELRDVVIGVSSGLLTSRMVTSELPLMGQKVTREHMAMVLRNAREDFWTPDMEILHAIPVGYDIDDNYAIVDPLGMQGETLTVSLHMVAMPAGPARNLLACIEQCHLRCEKLVATPYASALSTLMEDEVDLGVLHIDMGAGTTSASIFYRGEAIFTCVAPIGGRHISTDIALGLNVSMATAERIKTLYGSALGATGDEREQFEVPVMGGDHQMLPRSDLTKIIRPRLEEIFEMVQTKLTESGFAQMAGGRVVLTGGAAQLNGARELAHTILEKRARMASPMRLTGLPESATGPAFSACAGLLTYAGRNHADAVLKEGRAAGAFGWLGNWLRRNF